MSHDARRDTSGIGKAGLAASPGWLLRGRFRAAGGSRSGQYSTTGVKASDGAGIAHCRPV